MSGRVPQRLSAQLTGTHCGAFFMLQAGHALFGELTLVDLDIVGIMSYEWHVVEE